MEAVVETAVHAASERWKTAFNTGNAAGCAACYEHDALMVAKPFGEFKGRDAIEAFWSKLIDDGFCDVDYIKPKLTVIDETSAELIAGWRMNKASGVITRELWVLHDDDTALLREDHFEVTG